MAQDLRELFEKERKKQSFQMKEGHAERFLSKLDEKMPKDSASKKSYWLQIAASIIVVLGVSTYFTFNTSSDEQGKTTKVVESVTTVNDSENISLGDLSPDLQKLETYYLANINLELASLEISDKNKDLVAGYMEQLSGLSEEYNLLIKELNDIGPNDQTIEALIKNFQLQLALIQKLKTKLNQLKSSENEQQTNII